MRLLLFLLIQPLLCSGLNFLLYSPLMARSHINFMSHVADSLVDAGHNVTILAPLIDTNWLSTFVTKAEVITVPQCKEAEEYEQNGRDAIFKMIWLGDSIQSAMTEILKMMLVWRQQCNATLQHTEILNNLKLRKFDAAMAEPFDHCGSVIFRELGIEKFAAMLSTSAFEGSFFLTGLPSFPSYVPGTTASWGDKMTFIDRTKNALTFALMKLLGPMLTQPWQDLFQERIGAEFPGLIPILRNASFFFINNEPLIDFPRPTIHKMVDIGGISISTEHKPLNETWSNIMGLRKKTVLLSFGTVALSHLMPDSYKETIRETFRKFPDVTFIWKYEKPEHKISEGIDNIVETTWVPQHDMLYDSRLSLFITHCGQGSTNEATTAGVPLIVIPVLGDQVRNAQVIKRSGTGVVLEKSVLDGTDELEKAIREMLETDEYTKRARKLGEMIRDKPFTARETFVKNAEFMAKYGPLRMLDHYGLQLNFFQYYLIDVFAFIGFIVLVILTFTFLVLRSVYRFVVKRCVKAKQD